MEGPGCATWSTGGLCSSPSLWPSLLFALLAPCCCFCCSSALLLPRCCSNHPLALTTALLAPPPVQPSSSPTLPSLRPHPPPSSHHSSRFNSIPSRRQSLRWFRTFAPSHLLTRTRIDGHGTRQSRPPPLLNPLSTSPRSQHSQATLAASHGTSHHLCLQPRPLLSSPSTAPLHAAAHASTITASDGPVPSLSP